MANLTSNCQRNEPGIVSPSPESSQYDATSHVAILMCTYNGERFLEEQIESFESQTYRHWSLIVSDDGSKDGTLATLNTYQQRLGEDRLKIVSGPQNHFTANFLSLMCRQDVHADFYAWSDQDDIWDKLKLETAVAWLKTIPEHHPALYCGRTALVDESRNPIGLSPHFARPPSFSNALVQSIAGGNTMVFNNAARALLQEAGPNVDVPCHDWWAYQLIAGAGGAIFYDQTPYLLYRQHSNNVIGISSGWQARLQRLRMLVQGRFSRWNSKNIRALETVKHRLTRKNALALYRFKLATKQGLFSSFVNLKRSGVYRQTRLGNISLVLAFLIKGR